MKKSIILITVLALFLAISATAQIIRLEPVDGQGRTTDTDFTTDSVTHYQRYYFDMVDGAKEDTLQLLFWLYSSDGTPHVDLRFFTAMKLGKAGGGRKANKYKLSPDSISMYTDFTTEGLSAHEIIINTKDSVENDGGAAIARLMWPDAIVVAVEGATGNRADTKYFLKVLSRTERDD